MTASRDRAPGATGSLAADAPITTEEWHGWGPKDNSRPDLHIGPVPGRKRICLFLEHRTEFVLEIRVLATFSSEAHARAALEAIDMLTGHRR